MAEIFKHDCLMDLCWQCSQQYCAISATSEYVSRLYSDGETEIRRIESGDSVAVPALTARVQIHICGQRLNKGLD
jgi:hypothetical protein